VLGNFFKPRRMFLSKAGAYPSEAPWRYSILDSALGLRYKDTKKAGKTHQRKTLKLIVSINKLQK
jgi:hypothetical protein